MHSQTNSVSNAESQPKRCGRMRKKFSAAGSKVRHMDNFGSSPAFSLKDGEGSFGSLVGVFVSIFVFIFVIWYGISKYQIMNEYDDTNIMVSEKEIHYNDSDILSHKMGFNVGFAITRFDGDMKSIENEDIGVMKAYYKQYGLEEG